MICVFIFNQLLFFALQKQKSPTAKAKKSPKKSPAEQRKKRKREKPKKRLFFI